MHSLKLNGLRCEAQSALISLEPLNSKPKSTRILKGHLHQPDQGHAQLEFVLFEMGPQHAPVCDGVLKPKTKVT